MEAEESSIHGAKEAMMMMIQETSSAACHQMSCCPSLVSILGRVRFNNVKYNEIRSQAILDDFSAVMLVSMVFGSILEI
jgi:hypothetical protein